MTINGAPNGAFITENHPMLRAILLMTGLISMSAADAAILKQGETACRNPRALIQLQDAELKGDIRTKDWLLDGAACVEVPEDTEVRIVETRDELHQIRTVNRRKNVEFWAVRDAIQE